VKSDTTPEHKAEGRPFQFTGRIRSFRHAVVGILRMIRCQHNAWIHAVATGIVLLAGFLFRLSAADWCWVVVAISIVWTAEALNTTFEFLADAASPEFHPLVRDAKDVAAGRFLSLPLPQQSLEGLSSGRTWRACSRETCLCLASLFGTIAIDREALSALSS
jgi:diacylglycerol kinase (ATP)